MASSLSQRLQALADTYKETLALIQELKSFSLDATNTDERRVELANEIHETLKEQEDTLEVLRQEVEDDSIPNKRRGLPATRPDRGEYERNADLFARLQEDLKLARANFRKAQLQAKRQSDAFKRKEREELFADRKASVDQGDLRRRSKHEKLNQDELAMRSADDVTQALRRVHNQLEGELAQSQFAQQTLNESQAALEGLAESYTGTTDLLKSSRGLVGQLIRSNKSDSWYLRSAWWLLIITICWLFYRRILYGPSMLLIVYPFRLAWFTFSSIGTIILGKSPPDLGMSDPSGSFSSTRIVGSKTAGMPTNAPGRQPHVELPAKGGGWDRRPALQKEEEESMVEKIGRIAEQSMYTTSEADSLTEEVGEEQPRNTLKRMMEVDIDNEPPEHSRDEL